MNMSAEALGFLGAILGAFVGSGVAGGAAVLISRWETKSRFQLAALDRRLDAHQEAFALIRDLRNKVHTPKERDAAVLACQKCWNEKCLFLSEQARRDFYWAYTMAWDLDPKMFEEFHNAYVKALDSIQKGVALPPVGDVKVLPEKPPERSTKPKP